MLSNLHSELHRAFAMYHSWMRVCLCFSALFCCLPCSSPTALAITWAVVWHPSWWTAPSMMVGGTVSRLLGECPPQSETVGGTVQVPFVPLSSSPPLPNVPHSRSRSLRAVGYQLRRVPFTDTERPERPYSEISIQQWPSGERALWWLNWKRASLFGEI